jgi:hypothetical protein
MAYYVAADPAGGCNDWKDEDFVKVNEAVFWRLFTLTVMEMVRNDPWSYGHKVNETRENLLRWDHKKNGPFVMMSSAFIFK